MKNKKQYVKGWTVAIILLFIGIALAPSINANVDKQDKLVYIEVEQLDFKNIKESEELVWIRHPILYVFVVRILDLRYDQLYRSAMIAFNSYDNGHDILFTLFFARCIWIATTIHYWSNFWYNVSNKLRWNWDITPYP